MAKRREDAERRAHQCVRLARVLRVLQLITSRGQWDAAAIAKELECSERTVYRDLQTLMTAGVPWFFDEQCNSYRVQAGFCFPGLGDGGQESATGPGKEISEQSPQPESSPLHLARLSLAAARRLMSDASELVSILDRLQAALTPADASAGFLSQGTRKE